MTLVNGEARLVVKREGMDDVVVQVPLTFGPALNPVRNGHLRRRLLEVLDHELTFIDRDKEISARPLH